MTGIAMFLAFFFLYHSYIQDIIYEERLNQMEEITRQMFQNLEDVIDSNWDRVTEECNYLRDANVQTTDELCRHMKKKYELSVATSDGLIQNAILANGAKRISARELEIAVKNVNKRALSYLKK